MNWIKERLAREPLRGIWLACGSPVAAEMAGLAGFDWALLDLEHGLGTETDVLRMMQALSGTTAAPVVRVPSMRSDLIKRVLDFGAAGVMAPMIDNAGQAREFVRALRYPPAGVRGMTGSSRASGYGRDFARYQREANEHILGVVQIETAVAVENALELAAVSGVDVLFIGHSDLSLALGCYNQFDAPVLRAAEAKVLEACARHGKRAGILLRPGMRQDTMIKRGFSLLAMGSDLGCLKSGFQRLLAEPEAGQADRCAQ
ncbi:MAG: HpcH/HpaI aldolase/citrate lyase family protein [Kiritimatiellia bacterium]|nr:2-dehydro-3-deoxyglucarate aldolase [Lentisphaerota bacterium]